MGLCKCPKKKVTTLFCFEHTVNVCEHCLVTDHPRCVVQSYLRWLQDSDYDPSCKLCGKNLSDESCGPCVRLLCYDIFHWQCLDTYERSMPSTTAPAGFTCPTCTAPIFPPPHASSPVIQKLLELFSTTNWARSGLGMPMIEEATKHETNNSNEATTQKVHQQHTTQQLHHQQSSATASTFNADHSTLYARGIEKSDFLSGPPISSLRSNDDSDLNKYKRKPALQLLTRWFSNVLGSTNKIHQSSAKNNKMRRYSIIILFFIVTFGTIILFLKQAGRLAVEDDPLLDPLANPNIRVQSD